MVLLQTFYRLCFIVCTVATIQSSLQSLPTSRSINMTLPLVVDNKSGFGIAKIQTHFFPESCIVSNYFLNSINSKTR